jgi:hypothetical protein
MKQIYWDNFADEVVTEIDTIAPPERYVRIHCGSTIFKEKWSVDGAGGNYQCLYHYLDIAYTPEERENRLVSAIRHNMEDRHKVHLVCMTDWTVPITHYKKMENSLGDKE